jgi:hypothetical protein
MQVEHKVRQHWQVWTNLETIAGNLVTLCMDPNFTTITTHLIQRGEPEDQFDKKETLQLSRKNHNSNISCRLPHPAPTI